jgi:undecaprenyl-diphosphatase
LALLLGMGRKASARFSFFLAIPAILGASVLMIHDVLKSGQSLDLGPTLLGAATAFFVGLLALAILIRMLKQGNFRFFAFYCWTVGAAALLASFSFLK